MASDDKLCNFTFTWNVEWSKYDKVGGQDNYCPRKFFAIAYNNVVFKCHAFLFQKRNAEGSTTNAFGIMFDDGPKESIKDVKVYIGIVKSDGSDRAIRTSRSADALGHFYNLDDNNSAAMRAKYGLRETDALVFKIKMQIPSGSFSFVPPIDITTPAPDHPVLSQLVNSYNSIQNPENSKFSDAVLTSRDGVEFYCHKIIITQTDPLKTMFNDPLASLEEQPKPPPTGRRGTKRKATTQTSAIEDPSTGGMKKRKYPFKEMSTSSLKAMIEYLYTGQSTLNELTVTEIIQLANAAEQYLLKPLKQLCVTQLWKCVTNVPESAFEIARFADLHDDCTYLKDRALDVIVENYQNLNVKPKFLPKRFGGTRGDELRDDLVDYMEKRLRPDIG